MFCSIYCRKFLKGQHRIKVIFNCFGKDVNKVFKKNKECRRLNNISAQYVPTPCQWCDRFLRPFVPLSAAPAAILRQPETEGLAVQEDKAMCIVLALAIQ